MTHSTFETLLNYLENRLPDDERDEVYAHLGLCPQCQKRVTRLQAFLESVAEDQTVAPPQDLLRQAVDLARGRREFPLRKPWMRVIAALSFDSRLQFSAVGTRGAGRGRQMLFTTEQVDIDLQVKPGHTDSDLIGQMLATQISGNVLPAFVSLQNTAGTWQRATETDLLGQFTFRQIPSGIYDLIFDLENQEVAITGLEFQNE